MAIGLEADSSRLADMANEMADEAEGGFWPWQTRPQGVPAITKRGLCVANFGYGLHGLKRIL
jgi:hypothetical protein